MSTHGDLDHALDLRVLPAVEWRAAARAHRDRLDRLVGPYLERRAAGTTHPVVDFLFTYWDTEVGKQSLSQLLTNLRENSELQKNMDIVIRDLNDAIGEGRV